MSDISVEAAEAASRQALLQKLGIRHVLTDVFYYRDYRYNKFEDAVAQALRDQAKSI